MYRESERSCRTILPSWEVWCYQEIRGIAQSFFQMHCPLQLASFSHFRKQPCYGISPLALDARISVFYFIFIFIFYAVAPFYMYLDIHRIVFSWNPVWQHWTMTRRIYASHIDLSRPRKTVTHAFSSCSKMSSFPFLRAFLWNAKENR